MLQPTDEFLEIGDWGEYFQLTITTGTTTSTSTKIGVFFGPYEASLAGMVENASPSIWMKTSDVSTVKHGNTVITRLADSQVYNVTERKPDELGMTLLDVSRD